MWPGPSPPPSRTLGRALEAECSVSFLPLGLPLQSVGSELTKELKAPPTGHHSGTPSSLGPGWLPVGRRGGPTGGSGRRVLFGGVCVCVCWLHVLKFRILHTELSGTEIG